MKKRIIGIFIIFVILVGLCPFGSVRAASLTLSASASATTVTSGDTITVAVTSSQTLTGWTIACSYGNLTFSSAKGGEVNGSSVYGTSSSGTKSLATYTFKAPTVTSTTSYTIKFSGTSMCIVGDTDYTEYDNASCSVTIKVNPKATNTNTSTSSSTNTSSSSNTNSTSKSSSDATLKNLGITPNDFKNFKSGTLSYTVNVPYEVEKINIYAEKNQSGQTITGTGDKTLDVGKNTFNVKVTAADKKTTKTYTLIINRQAEATVSSDATLSNLGIKPVEYDFSTFKSATTSYDIDVPYEAESIEIYATKGNSKATVTGTGNKTLAVGKNTFSVKVTAEDGKTTKTYTLNINRQEKSEETTNTDSGEDDNEDPNESQSSDINGLTKLEIAGYTLDPEFSNDVYEYTLNIYDEIEKLDITTEVSSDDYEVDIAGNGNLQQGENVVTLLVYNKTADETTIYQLMVNMEENVDVSDINYMMDEAQDSLKKQIWIIQGTIVLIILLIIIYLIEKYKISKREKNSEKSDAIKDMKEKTNTEDNSLKTDNVLVPDVEEPKKKTHKKGKRFK